MKKKTKEIYKKCGIEIGNIHRDLEKWTKKEMKIAIIKWTDSVLHGTGTLSGKDKFLKPMEGFSCGLLVKQDKEGITIATDYWGNDEWRNCETIYKKQIKHFDIKEIKNGSK